MKDPTLIPYLRRVFFLWCRLVHRARHTNYWTQKTQSFWRCDKCGHHFAKNVR